MSEVYWRTDGPGWGLQSGMDQQHWSKLQRSIQDVFLNFFSQEKASGFCHSARLYYKPDLKCWSFPLEDLCLLVTSIRNVSFARGKASRTAVGSAGLRLCPVVQPLHNECLNRRRATTGKRFSAVAVPTNASSDCLSMPVTP